MYSWVQPDAQGRAIAPKTTNNSFDVSDGFWNENNNYVEELQTSKSPTLGSGDEPCAKEGVGVGGKEDVGGAAGESLTKPPMTYSSLFKKRSSQPETSSDDNFICLGELLTFTQYFTLLKASMFCSKTSRRCYVFAGKVVSRRRSCPQVDFSKEGEEKENGDNDDVSEEVGVSSPVAELSKITRTGGEEEDVEGWQEVHSSLPPSRPPSPTSLWAFVLHPL